MENHQSAMTFAESNTPEYVDDFLKDNSSETVEVQTPAKLLVVGEESRFPDEIMEYALDMAQRLSYEIVALNAAPLSCNVFKSFSEPVNRMCEDFKTMSAQSAAAFQEKAQSMGVPFTHVVKFTEPELAVEETIREYKAIDFVVSNRPEQSENRIENDNRPTQEIYVYTMMA
jgi:hypothetical protein